MVCAVLVREQNGTLTLKTIERSFTSPVESRCKLLAGAGNNSFEFAGMGFLDEAM